MPAYEYLAVTTVIETNWAAIRSLPEAERPASTFKYLAYIWPPGATKGEKRELGDQGVLAIFNELGRDGWRLVERYVSHTSISDYTPDSVTDWYGFKREIGEPMMERAYFIREVDQ